MVTNLLRNHTIKGTCNGMGEELPKDIICWISKYTIFPGMMYATNVSEHEESDGGYGYMFMNKIRTSQTYPYNFSTKRYRKSSETGH